MLVNSIELLYIHNTHKYDIYIYAAGNPKYGLHKVEVVEEATYVYNYSIVGGDVLDESLEKISFETKVEDATGGSVMKIVIKYHTKGDAPPPEEVLKNGKEKGSHLFKALDAYIAANPDL